MKKPRIFSKIMLLLLLTGSTQPIFAAPEIRYTQDKIRFITGGIGHDEVLEMRLLAKHYTLNLLFSEGMAGQSITSVNVNIYNEQSELVFRIKGAKPMLYVNLPAGVYTILASYNGEKLRHKIKVVKNVQQKVILNWKNKSEEADSRVSE
ncbi:MAG: hypothetical protein PHD12_08195 [Methylotenera sp.]|nr:hypothetical protein [Methylotenera sp.]